MLPASSGASFDLDERALTLGAKLHVQLAVDALAADAEP